MARRKKSLHFNLKEGENVPFHREHRSKRGRSRMNKDDTPLFFKRKKIMEIESLNLDVDTYSLRLMKRRYKIKKSLN